MLLFVLNIFIDEFIHAPPNKDLTWNLKKGRFGNRITHTHTTNSIRTTPIPALFRKELGGVTKLFGGRASKKVRLKGVPMCSTCLHA